MRAPWHTYDDTRPATGSSRPHAARMFLVICCLLFLGPARAPSQTGNDQEYRVKLAYLYNFAQFVQWPADSFSSPDAPLIICVVGVDPFQGEIGQALLGRTAGGHPMQIRKLKPDEDPKGCHIIFIRAGENVAARKILGSLTGANILTVGENNGFTGLGGLINLT
jgi:hypothetical protein